jgi:hypothetical protein
MTEIKTALKLCAFITVANLDPEKHPLTFLFYVSVIVLNLPTIYTHLIFIHQHTLKTFGLRRRNHFCEKNIYIDVKT